MHKQTYRYEAIKYPSNEDVFFNVLWHNRDYTAPHWHNGLEILYLLEGSEDCYLGEEECIRMKKGDFLVINSRVVHSVQCPRQCKEMLIQIPYPMMKRFIPQIDGLEFVCEKEKQAQQIREMIADFELEAKIICRKKHYVVYMKEGAAIVDLLNVMGARLSLMYLENLRVEKEVRNSVNRKVNCEAANITKTVNAASRQIEDILYLQKHYGMEKLPENLREMAEIRLEYPESSLQELGRFLNPPVGKSGVNHRLRKLSELADKIRV